MPFPRVYVAAPESGFLRFNRAQRILTAHTLDQVADVLAAASAESRTNYVAGFVSYEGASAFDGAQHTRTPSPLLPFAWFAVFADPPHSAELPAATEHFCGPWRAAIRRMDYLNAVESIRTRIAAGDVYQVNFTYPLRTRFAGCPLSLFSEMCARQPSPWRFFAETEEWAVCSASPECFFEHRNGVLRSRPMKGTRRAGRHAASRLAASEKDRAENLMIVDMIRNDMSRLPDAREVHAEALLEVREYPTVAQMTSTVACNTSAGIDDIFAAMFPCASVTGAPKIAAMSLIAALEQSPRGIYCGACGWAGDNAAQFNVAIRTAFVDKQQNVAEYGAGSGIVADSSAASEWQECRAKTEILIPPAPPALLETMRAEPNGVKLLARHLSRLTASARHFGIRLQATRARRLVQETCATLSVPALLRLVLSADGTLSVQTDELPESDAETRAHLSPVRVASQNELLRHKTTRRGIYQTALQLAQDAGFADAVLQNERGEITETCIANIAAKINGEWRTPPLSSGLLPGVMRAQLLAEGQLTEGVIVPADLRRADAICRINAVRGMEPISVQDDKS